MESPAWAGKWGKVKCCITIFVLFLPAVRRHCKLQSIQALHQAAGVSLWVSSSVAYLAVAGMDLGYILTGSLNECRRCKPVRGPWGVFWILTPLKAPSLVSESTFRQDIGQFHSPRMKACKLEDYFISWFRLGNFFKIYDIFLMNNLTNFLDPLSPNSAQNQFSPNDIHRLSWAKSMRINKMNTKRKIFDLLPNSLN